MYLRIKPYWIRQDNYILLDMRTLLTTFQPFKDKFIRNSRCAKSSEAKGSRHVFTKIFGPQTSQEEMFEGSIKHRVVEFLSGKSSTIMTYGMMYSGKTYTLFGTSLSPGIIMLSINLVFSTINCTVQPWYKRTFQDTMVYLNEIVRASKMQRKTRVLNGQSKNVNQISAEAKKFFENSQPGNPDKSEECDSEYAVWLSFAEIYNGNVYDLLDFAETRSPLKLYMNTEGQTVCDLRKMYAVTALEAHKIIMAGQSNMSVTGSGNSRSHTIFTMELVKYQKDCAAEEVIISSLTFCDLASSTQFKKSHMREVSSINNSLLVLGRCLKALSQNRMAPFRQSNLTRICQRALSGEENLSFIMNVILESSLNLLEIQRDRFEMQSIFNFCDIIRKLTNYHKECKQICEFEETIRDLETFDNTMTSSSNYQSPCESAEMIGCTDSSECRDIREQNRRLKQELEAAKSDMLNCEYSIRQQLADRYLRTIEELEGTYKENTKKIETEGEDLLKWSKALKQVESFYKERIDNLMQHKKRKRGNSGDYIVDSHTLYEELEAENAQVTSKVMVLKEAVKKLRQENKTILCEKNKYSFELALVTEELKKFRQLTRARIRKWDGNTENIEDDTDCLMNNLERSMDEKVKRTEEKLEEMSEYIRVIENKDAEAASGAKQKLSKSEYLLNDTLNEVKELEEELLQDPCIIKLQHHTQLQERQLVEVRQCSNDTKNESISDQKCDQSNISFEDYIADSSIQDDISVVKNPSRMCMNSTTIEQNEFNDWTIVPTLFADHVESTKKKFSNVPSVDRKSLFESSGSMDCSGSRSSDRSSKDDSGVSSELQRSTSISDHASIHENEDKCTETCVINEDNQNLVKENFEQLKDSADLNKWNYQEMVHAGELSEDLETIRDVIYTLNEETYANDYQMVHKEETLERLIEEKSEIGTKDDSVFKMTENKIEEYKREICELSRKLVVKEENENRISECLERYVKKSRAFEHKLSLLRNRLKKVFSTCANGHLPKIKNLEEELLQKISELDRRIAEMQHDFAKNYELFQKIYDFEIIVNKCQKDKNELYTQLYDCSETQLTLEDKLKKLTMKITERESGIISLKSEVRNIADLNVANNEKARNLSEQITEAYESIGLVKEDLHCCKDLRKNMENTMKAEIHNLKSQLSDQENNTTLLNEIYKTYSDSQDEITRLKMQLEHKELELTLLKTNKNASIKRYEILKHLQNEIEEKNKYFETANSLNNLERSLTENQKESEETLRNHEAKNSSANSSSFVPNHASSETLTVSSAPSEKSTTFFDEANDFDYITIKLDNESCQTESSIKSNIYSSVCETDSSEMEHNFNMRSSDTKDKKKSPNWMKVRKISGNTTLSRTFCKHTDINSDSEIE
ncbi:Kinesin-like protein KIF20B [Trachymyrmex septentrionalis]|uniref:Kinesin-like protein KIF20B n=2 Tax=Trachymyrmex septentrionalis TaxID=34720 RepID=A0A195FRC6_9HYME|nr:Kinesin-like protein KIF20B [Trachymyrmex septentrionalis]